jgi:LacI family transcriptional regulator
MKTRKNITITDISKKLNLSIATVSRALNNSDKVNPTTRDLILKTASELNYQQNHLALALKSGQSKIVGVVVPFLNHNFFSTVIGGIEDKLSSEGYHVAIYQTHENYLTEVRHLNALINAQVDGIFLSVSKNTLNNDHIHKVLKQNKPLIFFDRRRIVPGTSSVTIDDFYGGYEATKHLIEQGSKSIAHLAGDFNLEIYKQRFEGYRQALKDHGLKYHEGFLQHISSKIEDGALAINSIWKNKNKPDAIFSSSDFALTGAIKELRKLKLHIPDDLAIVGFGNEPFTQFMETPVSTVDQSSLKMGETAAEIFLKKIRKEESLTKENSIILKPTFLPRASSLRKSALINQKYL